MKPLNVLHLYRVRLRARLLQECFAVIGIAAGVALLFASQVASSSLSSSVAQLSQGIVGNAKLQLLARDSHGMDERLVRRVRALAGVRVAVPLLEVSANAIGPKASESVELVGADSSLSQLGGALIRHTHLNPFAGIGAIVLPGPLARTIGVTKFGNEATLQVAGRDTQAPLYEQLSAKQIGPLIDSPIAIAPLFFAQEIAGLKGRVSRILVAPRPGAEAQVRTALERIANGHLNVQSTDYDQRLFSKASEATNQSTALFAVISALVGFLFAFNAMLLTVPQRRRLIADLRRDGYTPRAVIAVLLLDSVVLGVLACVLGLVLGEELSIHLFHATPGYLSSAFAVGSQRVVSTQSVVVALAGGMIAAIVAVLSPLRDILSRDPLAAITPRQDSSDAGGVKLVAGGVVCLVLATVILAAAPKQAVLGMVFLVGALLLLLPIPLNGTLALVKRTAPAITSAVPHIASMELRAARARAIAIAATGAIAVFGSVAIQGAHQDLLHGLDDAAHDMNAYGSIWVSPAGSYNLLTTATFTATQTGKLEHLPGVAAVHLYRGELLDYGDRRVWVIAPPTQSLSPLPPSQILSDDTRRADERVRSGGWVALSEAIASEHHLHVGDLFTLPSPVPQRFRVAALSTNVGWAPGAIITSAADFTRAWGTEDAAAYDVILAPGASLKATMKAITTALGPNSGLAVQSAGARENRQRSLSRQGLARLTQIATLILIAAVLAMAAAMGNMVWQRRPRLAKLKLEGFPRRELWHTIMLESFLLLGVGCLTGAVFGLYGQQLLDRALANVINFPVVYSVGVVVALVNLALVTAAAVAMAAVPGYLATNVAPAVALQD
ncbi:MAG TPA: FtsX-like permease family protein [Solirubrobacteraceae bacterium]